MQSIVDLLKAATNKIDMPLQNGLPSDESGISSRLKKLDTATNKLVKGNLYLVAGYKSAYKTSLLLKYAISTAIQDNRPIIFFTQQETAVEITLRMISQISQVPIDLLNSGKLEEEHWEKLSFALELLNEAEIFIKRTSLDDINFIREIHSVQTKHGQQGLIIIDDLHLMNNRTSQCSKGAMNYLMQLLNRVADEFEVPILAAWRIIKTRYNSDQIYSMQADLQASGFDYECNAASVIYLNKISDNFPHNHQIDTVNINVWNAKDGNISNLKCEVNRECISFNSN